MSRKKRYPKKLRRYAKKALNSKIFQRSFREKHHLYTSVGTHSVEVADCALRLSEFLKRHGKDVDERLVVRAALLHDLGLVGRHQKYHSNWETSRRHPIDSAKIAGHIYPENKAKLDKIIKRHMFPVSLCPPDSIEGAIVSLADKWCSISDALHMPARIWAQIRKRHR